ncbi:uncharacterized, partial [Tachysurus ichikawai]
PGPSHRAQGQTHRWNSSALRLSTWSPGFHRSAVRMRQKDSSSRIGWCIGLRNTADAVCRLCLDTGHWSQAQQRPACAGGPGKIRPA